VYVGVAFGNQKRAQFSSRTSLGRQHLQDEFVTLQKGSKIGCVTAGPWESLNADWEWDSQQDTIAHKQQIHQWDPMGDIVI